MIQLSSQMNHQESKTSYGRFVWGSVHWNEYVSVYVCSHLFLPSYRSISSSIWFYQSSYNNSLDIFWYSLIISLLEKCPNTDFSLVRISLYAVWIQENTDQKKLLIWTLFTRWNYLILSWLLCPKVSKVNKVKLSLYFKT